MLAAELVLIGFTLCITGETEDMIYNINSYTDTLMSSQHPGAPLDFLSWSYHNAPVLQLMFMFNLNVYFKQFADVTLTNVSTEGYMVMFIGVLYYTTDVYVQLVLIWPDHFENACFSLSFSVL